MKVLYRGSNKTKLGKKGKAELPWMAEVKARVPKLQPPRSHLLGAGKSKNRFHCSKTAESDSAIIAFESSMNERRGLVTTCLVAPAENDALVGSVAFAVRREYAFARGSKARATPRAAAPWFLGSR